MEKNNYILKIGVALTLLLFSVAIRSNMFVVDYATASTFTSFSIDTPSGFLISSDNTNYVDLICVDDNSDDDDHHAYLFPQRRNSIRGLCSEKHFCYNLQSASFSFFFSSDTSPPLG